MENVKNYFRVSCSNPKGKYKFLSVYRPVVYPECLTIFMRRGCRHPSLDAPKVPGLFCWGCQHIKVQIFLQVPRLF
ncbi:unnamed protein product [Larinioides sclopetarius]|uniref:Uncharacterized protein n=1 Tax=Larinioides sclopetarius TaxID=280406 RepID=A0AAV2C1D2_9ARAC